MMPRTERNRHRDQTMILRDLRGPRRDPRPDDDFFRFALDESAARPYCVFMRTEQQKRGDDGKYTKHTRCDGCGGTIKGDYLTDDEVCEGGDGPGFFICERKRCGAKLEKMDTAARRTHYFTQRAKNEAVS